MVTSFRDVAPAALGLLATRRADTDGDMRRQTLALAAAAVAAGQPLPLLAAALTLALVAVALIPRTTPAHVPAVPVIDVLRTPVLGPILTVAGAPHRWHPARLELVRYLKS